MRPREAGGKVIAIYTKACLDRADFTGGGASGCIDPASDDADHDGIADSADNAPGVFNPTQNDADGDDTADVLDADPDGDGLLGIGDPCPYDPLNSCSGDTDSDGIPNGDDPWPTWPGDCWTNPDADNDGDGVANKEDNCPWTANADQADTNANGVGDICECDDEETGGCPPELAEQYVYGSETDGRIVTVRPARARDMQDHRGDTVFTRVLDKKEYELNDHLGNVRVRFGDVKKSTGTAGTSPYAIDMKGYVNYYPFGMAQPGREVSMSGGRYGYNGKEMDNEWNNAQGVAGNEGTGNAYDYGFRIYDPRVARFLSEDPLTSSYAGWSPYAYAMNTPIGAIDLDGLEALEISKVDILAKSATVTVKKVIYTLTEGDLAVPSWVVKQIQDPIFAERWAEALGNSKTVKSVSMAEVNSPKVVSMVRNLIPEFDESWSLNLVWNLGFVPPSESDPSVPNTVAEFSALEAKTYRAGEANSVTLLRLARRDNSEHNSLVKSGVYWAAGGLGPNLIVLNPDFFSEKANVETEYERFGNLAPILIHETGHNITGERHLGLEAIENLLGFWGMARFHVYPDKQGAIDMLKHSGPKQWSRKKEDSNSESQDEEKKDEP